MDSSLFVGVARTLYPISDLDEIDLDNILSVNINQLMPEAKLLARFVMNQMEPEDVFAD